MSDLLSPEMQASQERALNHLKKKIRQLNRGSAYSIRQVVTILGIRAAFVTDNKDFIALSQVVAVAEKKLIAKYFSQPNQSRRLYDALDFSQNPPTSAYFGKKWQDIIENLKLEPCIL